MCLYQVTFHGEIVQVGDFDCFSEDLDYFESTNSNSKKSNCTTTAKTALFNVKPGFYKNKYS